MIDLKKIISENYKSIANSVYEAAAIAGRDYRQIKILAVTKQYDKEINKALFELDIVEYGENKVQNLVAKIEEFTDAKYVKVKWHMIGNLQKNKVKYIVGRVDLIHSISDEALLVKVNSEAYKKKCVQDCLLEVNIANETTKHGFNASKVKELVKGCCDLTNVNIKGLMCMVPYIDDKSKIQNYFRELRLLSESLAQDSKNNYTPQFLSMGMSNDYIEAIKEGSNIIRIGTSLFKGLS